MSVDKVVTIEKLDAVKLRQEKQPYTMHMNYVLQNVRHPLALAIWCYLTSLPDDWHIYRSQLMDHFDVGRDKLADALKYLKDNKLIEYIQFKDDSGKFGISHILVRSGYEFEVIHRNDTAPLKNRNTVLPDNGKTAPTKEIINTKEITKQKPYALSSKNEQQYNKPNELRCTVKEWGPGHPSYDSIKGSGTLSNNDRRNL